MNNIQIVVALFLVSLWSWVSGFFFNGMVVRDKGKEGTSVFPVFTTLIVFVTFAVLLFCIALGGIK